MLRRSRKLLMLGILSLSMMTCSFYVSASEETSENVETSAPETSVPETSAPETSAPETSAPETSTPETSAPEPAPDATSGTDSFESESSSGTEAVPETSAPEEKQTENKDPDAAERAEKEENMKNSPYRSNSELIAHQNIISVKPVTRDFRFAQVDASKAIIKTGSVVYEEKNSNSRIAGIARKGSAAYILADENEDWVYIESGSCRGFVERENLISGSLVEFLMLRESSLPSVKPVLNLMENTATAYTKTSAYSVVVDKVYAIAKTDLSIYDDTNMKQADTVGTLSKDGLAFILAEKGNFYFVESGNVRGFAPKSSFVTGDYAQIKASQKSENNFETAEEKISPEENKACYYTLTSVNEADDHSVIRESIVNFALQFVGNPYVWGGTSLTNGADCSGFVQSIYANYGYGLPRVACDQASYGTQIPVNEAEPGDLIFYAENGYVYHVFMYIGDGQVVHALNSNAGIVTTGIGSDAVWATRIL